MVGGFLTKIFSILSYVHDALPPYLIIRGIAGHVEELDFIDTG
jgi:hypothetical protein